MVPQVDASTIAEPGAVRRVGLGGPRRTAAAALRHPIAQLAVRRLSLAAALLFVVTALTFVLVSLTPGDPAHQILGLQATPEAIAKLHRALGLDQPVYEQYWNWLKDAASGDLGTSMFSGQPVADTIGTRLPVTLSLMFGSLLVSLIVGVWAGVTSAVRGGAPGRIVDALSLIGFALPAFWIGALLISVFAVRLGWLPATGYVSFAESPVDWLRSLVLPVLALSLGGIAAIAKQTREAMLDALASEYVRMAWANGVPARSIFLRHCLKNAGMTVLTITGVQAVGLLGGTVIVENVFAIPGLGTLAVNAAVEHDIPLIQGVVVCFTLIVLAINLLIDVAYSWLNPRVRAV